MLHTFGKVIWLNDKFVALSISVPERLEPLGIVTKGFAQYGIPHKAFMDKEHHGQPWNFSRLLIDACTNPKYQGKHVFTSTDDIILLDGWYEKAVEVINQTDYQVVTFFTNLKYKPDDVCDIKTACQNWWLYDVLVLFRSGVLNQQFLDDFIKFCTRDDVHKMERRHYDQMLSHFLYVKGFKCGIVRPNYVELQDVKSVLGHSIKDSNKRESR